MTPCVSLLLAMVAVSSALACIFDSNTSFRAQSQHWTPFTAAMVERWYSANDAMLRDVENYLYAMPGDGSQMTDYKRQIMPNGGWGDQRVITDLTAHKRVSVDPSTESLTTLPYSGKTVARLATPPSACGPNPSPGPTLLGYATVVVKTTLPSPPGETIERTTWEAPAFNCFAPQESVDFRHSDSSSPSFRNMREAIFVKEGEPLVSLFEVPAGYVERSPFSGAHRKGPAFS